MKNLIAHLFQAITYHPTRLMLVDKYEFKVYGSENIENLNGPFIFAPNHTSIIDGPIVAASMPRAGAWYPKKFFPVKFVVSEEFFYWFKKKSIFRSSIKSFSSALYVRINGSIPLKSPLKFRKMNIKNRDDILKVTMKESIYEVLAGRNICIFPEGRLSKDGSLRKGKLGVAYVHSVTNAPIIPIGISGAHRLCDKKNIVVRIGKPIYSLDNPSKCDLETGTKKIMSAIQGLLD